MGKVAPASLDFADLLAANVDFHADLVRNIPGIRTSQHLFDDLSDDPADWDVAIATEALQRQPADPAVLEALCEQLRFGAFTRSRLRALLR